MGGKKDDGGRQALLDAQQAAVNRALKEYEGMEQYLPSISSQEIDLATPEVVGKLTAEQLGESALAGISTDPRLRAAQMKSLQALQKQGAEGLSESDKLILNQMQRQAASTRAAQDKAILQEMGERGMGGSGAELISRLQASQNAANQMQQAGMQTAAQNEQAKIAALAQAGQLGGQIEQADWQKQATAAQAKDAIAQMNAQMRQQVAAQNLAEQQRISETAKAIQNQQQMYNKQLLEKQFNQRMGLAGSRAGVLAGQANMLGQQAAMTQGEEGSMLGTMLPAVGTIGGGVIGAIYGGPAGAAAGATIGGAAGQMGSTAVGGAKRRTYADGRSPADEDLRIVGRNVSRDLNPNDVKNFENYRGMQEYKNLNDEELRKQIKASEDFQKQEELRRPIRREDGGISSEPSFYDKLMNLLKIEKPQPKETVSTGIRGANGLILPEDEFFGEFKDENITEDFSGSFADGGIKEMPLAQRMKIAQKEKMTKSLESGGFKTPPIKKITTTFKDGGIAKVEEHYQDMHTYQGEPASEQSAKDVRGMVNKTLHAEDGALAGYMGGSEYSNLKDTYGDYPNNLPAPTDSRINSRIYATKALAEGGVVEKDLGKIVTKPGAVNTGDARDVEIIKAMNGYYPVRPLQMPNDNTDQYSSNDYTLKTNLGPTREEYLSGSPNTTLQKSEFQQASESQNSSNDWLSGVGMLGGALGGLGQKEEATPRYSWKPIAFENLSKPYKSPQFGEGGIADSKVGQFRDGPNQVNNFLSTGAVENISDVYGKLSNEERDYLTAKLNFDVTKNSACYEDGGVVHAADGKVTWLPEKGLTAEQAYDDYYKQQAQKARLEAALAKNPENKMLRAQLEAKARAIKPERELPARGFKTMRGFAPGLGGAALNVGSMLLGTDENTPTITETMQEGYDDIMRMKRAQEEKEAAGMANGGFSDYSNEVINPGHKKGGIVEGETLTGDKIPAQLNAEEMVTNLAQQQKTKDALNGEHTAPYVGNRVDEKVENGEYKLNKDAQKQLFDFLSGKTSEPPKKDIVEPVETEELKSRISALEKLLK